MKELFLVSKLLFKNTFRSTDKKKRNRLLTSMFVLIYFGFFSTYIIKQAIDVLSPYNMEYLVIKTIIILDISIVAFQSIVSSLNIFYFSDDLKNLLSLPIKNKNFYLARLNMLLYTEYFFEILIFVIPLGYYGVYLNLGIFYFIKMLFLLLVIPIIASGLISFIMVRMVALVKGLGNKDRVQYGAILMSLILVFAISYFTNNTGNGVTDKQLFSFMNRMDYSVNSNIITAYLINDLTDMVVLDLKYSIISFIRVCIYTFVIYYVLSLINLRTYKKNVLINFDTGKKAAEVKDLSKENISRKSLWKSYLGKEFKIIIRTPQFFMQCMVAILIIPLIIFMPFILNVNNLESMDLPSIEIIKTGVLSKTGLISSLVVVQVFYLVNINSSVCISRDNQNATFMKYIPIRLYKQIIYKSLVAIILNLITNIELFIVYIFVLGIDIKYTLLLLITTLLLSVFESLLLVKGDLKRPKINWNIESEVVRSNINIVIGYLTQIIVCAVLCTLVFLATTELFNVLLVLDIVLLFAIRILINYYKRNEEKLFINIY